MSSPFDIDIGGGDVIFPVLANATTAESIRDRIIDAVTALTPNSLTRDRFRAYRNENGADFMKYADDNSSGAFRRFQVRDNGEDDVVAVSNTDYDMRFVTFQTIVAYPQTTRTGPDQALDRDDAMDTDFHQIDYAIGIYGRANFSPITVATYPDATPLGAKKDVVHGVACDFLVITTSFSYRRISQ